MKLLIVILLMAIQVYGYYNSYDRYLHDRNRIANKKIELEHKRHLENLEYQKEQSRNRLREKRNREANLANEKRFRELKDKNYRNKNDEQQLNYVKKNYFPKDFKNKPQIKLGKLHILGVKSIKLFKQNKYIIKATSGTYALPKDKLEAAEKINFTEELEKWKTYRKAMW